MPLVSVVIPAFNHEAYVREALDSAANEGYPALEIVVIDDGSTDSTWAKIQEWRQANGASLPVTSLRQSNAGLTRTLNRLLDLARGEFVVMLASDDRLLPGGIAPRVELLESSPELLAVFADCRKIDADGAVLEEHLTGFGDPRARERMTSDPAREIVKRWSVPGPVILYRRHAIQGIGGYSEDLMLEDWDLYLRLASRNAIAYLDQVVADYRWHGDNTVARAEHSIGLADELREVAWRSRKLFGGHLYLELVHESASWAARSAWLRRRWIRWAWWKSASVVAKLVSLVVPRRPSDQKLAPTQ